MVNVRAVIAAEIVIRDGESNRISVINIHEQFRPLGFPLLIPRFAIFTFLERDLSDSPHQEVQVLVRVGESQVVEQTATINFGPGRLTRFTVEFQGFVVSQAGDLRVTVRSGTSSADSQLIEVLAPAPTAQIVSQTH